MEPLSTPNAVQFEIDWRLQGGTPYDVQVVRGVQWDAHEYPHVPLVAIRNRQDQSYAHYFCCREEIEAFLTALRDAMAQAWPDSAASEL